METQREYGPTQKYIWNMLTWYGYVTVPHSVVMKSYYFIASTDRRKNHRDYCIKTA